MEVCWEQREDCFLFQDVIETAASLFDSFGGEEGKQLCCIPGDHPETSFQKHLSWSRRDLPISMDR